MRKPPNERASREKVAEQGARTRSSRAKSRGARDESVQAPLDYAPDERGSEKHTPERTCILTRASGPREGLIRLALSPEGEVLPDVRAKAPGRGAWISVDRGTLEEAQAKGKLRGALARAFKGAPLSVPDDLGARIEAALRQAALDRLGLEARAGTLLTGSDRIEDAARKGQVAMLLHASDASEDGNRKLDQAWRVGGGEPQGLVIPAERAILSLALGRQNVVHVAIVDSAAAARVRHALDRWRAFLGTDSGLSAATASAPDASAVDVNEGL